MEEVFIPRADSSGEQHPADEREENAQTTKYETVIVLGVRFAESPLDFRHGEHFAETGVVVIEGGKWLK